MICYKKGYKYQLTKTCTVQVDVHPLQIIETHYITLDTTGLLTISRGYAWDGSSGPTVDTESSMEASLVHDALYQLMRMGLLDRKWRECADFEYKRLCLENDMYKFRAWYQYRIVKKVAAFATDPKNKKIEYCTKNNQIKKEIIN